MLLGTFILQNSPEVIKIKKSIKYLAIISIAALSATSYATGASNINKYSTQGPYVQVQLGAGNVISDGSLNIGTNFLVSKGDTIDTTGLAGRISVGYVLNRFLSAEVGIGFYPSTERVYNPANELLPPPSTNKTTSSISNLIAADGDFFMA